MSAPVARRSGPVGVGIIGAGVISGTYLDNLAAFPDTEVLAVGDLDPDAARARATEHGVGTAGEVAAVLDHPDVEVVVNLTIPRAHAEVASQVLASGRHVWNEKPLALDRASAAGLLASAESAGLRVGCAPDTFLGDGLQTTRRLLEGGAIGTPLTALVLLQTPGPQSWHPNPAFLFGEGGGPLFDMGPYYLTALAQVFGPVASVAGISSKATPTRTIGSGPRAGEQFDVVVPSQFATLVGYESGQSATMIYSFDSAVKRTLLEITGSEGSMLVPDPNRFDGAVSVRRAADEEWQVVAETEERSSRGTGVLELARAIREDRPHRASGALAGHVLDTMVAITESGASRQFVPVASTVDVPDLLPEDWDPRAATV